VPTSEGWLYVAAVMNVKSRKIIGCVPWSDKLVSRMAGFSAALRDAVGRQKPLGRADPPFQIEAGKYASYAYQELYLRIRAMYPEY